MGQYDGCQYCAFACRCTPEVKTRREELLNRYNSSPQEKQNLWGTRIPGYCKGCNKPSVRCAC